MTESEKREQVAKVPLWFHSHDFGDGVVAPGWKTLARLQEEWALLQLPALAGKSVLDINTWDGWFAMQAEQAGAGRVVGLDSYMWSMDLGEHNKYWAQHRDAGTTPKPFHEMPYYRPHELPGKIGFDTARRLNNSRVEEAVGDFATMDLSGLREQFDVVFYLGTLYHMADPLGNLKRLFEVTAPGGLAVVETHAVFVPGFEHVPLCENYGPIKTLNGDSSNWWGPNALALQQMLLASGFDNVTITVGPPPETTAAKPTEPPEPLWTRLSRAIAPPAPQPANGDATLHNVTYYRAYAHAFRKAA